MAWTTDDLTKIEQAIATGALEVEYETHRVKYRSIDDLLKAKQTISQALDAADTTTTPVARQVRFVTNKGTDRV